MSATRVALAGLGTLCLLGACARAPATEPSGSASPSSQSAGTTPSASGRSATASVKASPIGPAVAAGIAFVREVDGVQQVFVVEREGAARQVSGLGEHAASGGVQPVWSPDHSMVAFGPPAIGSGLNPQLWVVNADGSDQRPIATLGESIDWSPDSNQLVYTDSVFTTDNTGEPARIWIANVRSSEVKRLGPRGNATRWVPDGKRISYAPAEEPSRIMVIPVSGGQPRELIEGGGVWWSPDGSSVLVQRDDGVYIANADGSNARLLIDGVASPAWSPDGTRIAFVDVNGTGDFTVGVADIDGNVLWSDTPGTDPAWSPDGSRLAVDVTISEPSIHIVDASTGNRLWELAGRYPDW